MEVRDTFTWNGNTCVIVNKSEYREPSMMYLLDVYQDGEYKGEAFVGEVFFEQEQIERVEEI